MIREQSRKKRRSSARHPRWGRWEWARPQVAMRGLANAAGPHGGLSIAMLGTAWALLSALLHLDGHTPAFPSPIVPATTHYLWQALFVLPLVWSLARLYSSVAHALTRPGVSESDALGGTARAPTSERPTPAGLHNVLAVTYAAPMLGLHIAPETVSFIIGGHDALSSVARVTMPIAALCVWGLGTLALVATRRARLGRASLAALAGLVAQALVGATILR